MSYHPHAPVAHPHQLGRQKTGFLAPAFTAQETPWTELWKAPQRRPRYTPSAYIVTHGLPAELRN